ncbi:MAG: cyclase family protein [Candidatus Nitrosocaldus sp.]|nr:cyclase family protein [Candidatus Nitrosocaldus sp.]MDW8276161.1 cyclase family protein [Candidatus Nitrosocaldus sp.]
MARLIDLTRMIEYDMPVFEQRIRPMLIPWSRLDLHGYELELMFMSTHTGTHMDAPSHFSRGMSIDEIPLDVLVSHAVLVEARKGEKGYIYKDDLRELDGYDLEGRSVIISTGWEDRWGSPNYLSSNPGLSRESAEYLLGRGVILVGIDTANIDHPEDRDFTVHRVLLPNGIPIVENLCNLRAVGRREFRLIASPLKIRGSTGSPIRALAMID